LLGAVVRTSMAEENKKFQWILEKLRKGTYVIFPSLWCLLWLLWVYSCIGWPVDRKQQVWSFWSIGSLVPSFTLNTKSGSEIAEAGGGEIRRISLSYAPDARQRLCVSETLRELWAGRLFWGNASQGCISHRPMFQHIRLPINPSLSRNAYRLSGCNFFESSFGGGPVDFCCITHTASSGPTRVGYKTVKIPSGI
jgi:hypothetical protein